MPEPTHQTDFTLLHRPKTNGKRDEEHTQLQAPGREGRDRLGKCVCHVGEPTLEGFLEPNGVGKNLKRGAASLQRHLGASRLGRRRYIRPTEVLRLQVEGLDFTTRNSSHVWGPPQLRGGGRLHGTLFSCQASALGGKAYPYHSAGTGERGAPHTPSHPPSRTPLQPQGIVQGDQLAQEAPVGDDTAVVLHRLYGFYKGHVVADHEVGEDQGGRPAHPDSTVHKDPSWGGGKTQGLCHSRPNIPIKK